MNKEQLKKLALLGISGGVMLTGTQASTIEGLNNSSAKNAVTRSGCGAGKCGSQMRHSCGGGNGGSCGGKNGNDKKIDHDNDTAEYNMSEEEMKQKKIQTKEHKCGGNGCSGKNHNQDKEMSQKRNMEHERTRSFQGQRVIDENSFADMLNNEMRGVYQNLDLKGRNLAMRYASQSNFSNPNEAVRRASEEISK